MNQQNLTLWQVILQFGSISGLLTLFYTISQNLKKKPRFKFDFRSSSGTPHVKDNLEYYRLVFDGYIKNQSIEPNSITNICYAVWGNKARTKTLSYGGQPCSIVQNPNSEKVSLDLPISFKPREGKHFQIEFDVVLTGTHDKALVSATKPVFPGSNVHLPEYDYQLTFRDVNENLFDDSGTVRSEKLRDLWWLLPNTFNKLKEGNPLPYARHMLKIFWYYILFRIRRGIAFFGF